MTVLEPRPAPSPDRPPAPPARRSPSRWRSVARRVAVVAAAIAVWWFGTTRLGAGNAILSRMGPFDAFAALGDLLSSGAAGSDVLTSLRRLGLGLLIATALGVPLGVLVGSRAAVEHATAPLVQFLRMLSPLAWAPGAVAVFGIGDAPVTFLVAVATVWPLMLGTAAGVRALDPGWLKVARSLGASPIERVRTVVLPGVRPHVLTSLRLALGVGWVVLVPAEMLGVNSGLGYAVLNARDQLAYDQLAATMLLIGMVGFAIDLVFQRVLAPAARR